MNDESSEDWSEDDNGSELEDQIAELSERIERLESEAAGREASAGLGVWGLGMAIAVVLSWSRNASILWCILHGIFSWGYVIYFAFTRH